MKKAFSILILLTMFVTPLVFVGCHIIEVNMVQRSILEDGDGTNNSHSNLEKKYRQESDSMKLIVPIK